MSNYRLLGLPVVTIICFSVAAVAPDAAADIVLVDSVGFASNIGSTEDADGTNNTRTVDASELGSFNPMGVDKLVVTVGGEGMSNGGEDNDVTSITYGGVPMLPVLERYGGGNRGSEMWYLDNVSVTGKFVITHVQSQSGLGFGAYALTGTVTGFVETASTTVTMNVGALDAYNADMEMPVAGGEFVVAALARNNMDTGGGIGVQAPLIELFYGATDGSSAASAYQLIDSPGTVTPTIFRLSNGVGSVIAATFASDPSGVGPEGTFLLVR